ncbi:MAG: hypothetical protein WBZ37_26030 [Mycobacterium sp.]
MRVEGKADRTLVLYGQSITCFSAWLAKRGQPADVSSFDHDTVLQWPGNLSPPGGGCDPTSEAADHTIQTSPHHESQFQSKRADAAMPGCVAPLVAKGRNPAHSGRSRSTAPITAVDAIPDAATVFVGTLLWSPSDAAARILELVADDDLASPALSLILSAIRRLTAAGQPCGAQIVMDELRRCGALSRDAPLALMDAASSGAVPEAATVYAAAAVAESLRRKVESAGVGLQTAAATAAEADLAPLASRAAANVVDCAARLATLRGSAL